MADLTAGKIPKAADGNHIEDGYDVATSIGTPGVDTSLATEKAVRDIADTKAELLHATDHTDGTDDIQDATAVQKGVATAAQIAKLDGIEALADITDPTNVASAGALMVSTVDAKGDLLAGTGDDAISRLPVGINGQQLAANNSKATGLEWVTPGNGTFVHIDNTDSPYTPGGEGIILCDTTGGAITINLPAVASSSGVLYRVKKLNASANNVTLDGNGTETIDDSLTKDITAQYESLDVFCDGTEWWVL